MISIHAVPPNLVRTVAGIAEHLIKKACDPFPWLDPEKLIADAENRDAVFWLIADGVEPIGICVTRLQKYADGLVVEVRALGGERGLEWAKPIRARLKEFAKAEGAVKLVTAGPKAWGRIFGLTPTVKYYYEDRV